MRARFRQAIVNPFTIIGVVCMLVLMLFHAKTSIYYYLTIAQLIYVPVVVCQIVKLARWQSVAIVLGQLAVTSLFFITNGAYIWFGASIYFFTTLSIGWSGLQRFLKRGFTNTAEVMIDLGLLYIVMGGGWFFAHITGISTGFSPIITWLTAIHFHFSACLLCITVGLLGRIWRSRYFTFCAAIIAAGPMLVAAGITFSRMIEIVSVSLYVVAIFSLTIYTFRIRLKVVTSVLVRLAFCTLCFTIIWSFFYAYSNLTGIVIVDIPDMLKFHGVLNCILFGGVITIAWGLYVPESTHQSYSFPLSEMRGKVKGMLEGHHALVDDMGEFINTQLVPSRIYDFYENTINYSLTASVKWAVWFKPFAFLYQFISRKIGQLNLPFSSKPFMMDGTISKVNAAMDGRDNPRVWQRFANGQTIFSAIYAIHKDNDRAYMNIALPLPKSAMHGILVLQVKEQRLYLTSDANGDAGTYFSIGPYSFKLPLHEYFAIWEEKGELRAIHRMTLFGLKFLHIDYWIKSRYEE